MSKKPVTTEAEELCELIIHGMKEKKGLDITQIDLRKINNSVADFFIICSGNSDTQVDSLAHSIEEQVFKTKKENPTHIEGKKNKEWMLIDYINVVAHVFQKDTRDFYNLEGLWGDAKITEIETPEY